MVVPSWCPLDAGAIRDSSSTSQDEQWWLIARQLGLRLQRTHITKGLSQEALAHAASVSSYTYQKFKKGESRPGIPMNPRLRTLIALATALDMQVEELVGELSEQVAGGVAAQAPQLPVGRRLIGVYCSSVPQNWRPRALGETRGILPRVQALVWMAHKDARAAPVAGTGLYSEVHRAYLHQTTIRSQTTRQDGR